MTHQQAIQAVLAFLYDAYPNTPPPANPEQRVAVWAESLSGCDPDRILAAAKSWVARGNRFMPNLGEIHETMRDITYGALPSEAEAWAACTASSVHPEVHPMLRKVLQLTGGRNSLAWMNETDARRSVRGAYFQALRQFQIDSEPDELPQRSLEQRRGGQPQPVGFTGAITDGGQR
jgi:hypothetical protein